MQGHILAKRPTMSLTMKFDEQDDWDCGNCGGSFNEDVRKKIKSLGYYSIFCETVSYYFIIDCEHRWVSEFCV